MLTEISYVLSETGPKWSTSPMERYEINSSISAGDPHTTSSVYHHLHNGTHVDAPKHFSKNGRSIVDIPIEDFYYTSPLILSIPKRKGEAIRKEELQQYEKELEKADILCLYTGYADLRNSKPGEYVDKFPCLSVEAARYLRTGFPLLKAIVIDTISVESSTDGPPAGFPVHRMLLDEIADGNFRTLLLYEDVNLKKLVEINQPVKAICAFPVRWKDAEAAPVNIVAIS
jgi:kynurenine formamidase